MLKILLPVSVLLLALVPSLKHVPQQHRSLDSDSTQFEITPLIDSLGLLDGYKVYVFTPICEVEQCYSVQLDIYTDVIGRFLSYDTLKGHEFTKLDHEPFAEEDYQRLQNILTDPNSILSAYKKEELVENTRESEIEGFTGATALEIKNTVIEGAVYSCHTLWHIAHGPLVDSLQSITATQFSEALVQKLTAQPQQPINYFLLNHFSPQDFEQYLPQILYTIETGAGYYPKNALERMPASVLNSEKSQQFFSTRFPQLDYFSQVALLKKLDPEALTEDLKSVLVQSMEERGSLKDQLITRLIARLPDGQE